MDGTRFRKIMTYNENIPVSPAERGGLWEREEQLVRLARSAVCLPSFAAAAICLFAAALSLFRLPALPPSKTSMKRLPFTSLHVKQLCKL